MNRRDAAKVLALAALPRCGQSVFPEEPLSDSEQRLANSVSGDWFGPGDFLLVDGTSYPGGDVRTAWWQLRLRQVGVRRFNMNWSTYLRNITALPPYSLIIDANRLIVDPLLRYRSAVSVEMFEAHSFSGGVEMRGESIFVDITMSQQFIGPNATHLERRRFTVPSATRTRP